MDGRGERPVPTIEQIHHVLAMMPTETEIDRRNRAVVAFALVTGARDVRTKYSKSFDTWFFPVGDDLVATVVDWIEELRTMHLMGDDNPVFPASRVAIDPATRRFAVVGLDRKGWSNAGPIREIFRNAFEAAGLPYCNPHSIRKTLAQYGERLCTGPEAMKAWSQNLGHDHVATTFTSYGQVPAHRQAEIIRGLGAPKVPDAALAVEIAAILRRHGGGGFEFRSECEPMNRSGSHA